MQPTLQLAALASSAAVLVQGQPKPFPGQIFQPPVGTNDLGELVQQQENGELVVRWNHYDAMANLVARVETCPFAQDFQQMFVPGLPDQDLSFNTHPCALTQNVTLEAGFCSGVHTSNAWCRPVFFTYSQSATKRADDTGVLAELHVTAVRQEDMERRAPPSSNEPYQMPRHPFYDGEASYEFSVTSMIPALKEEVALEVHSSQATKAFLVVKEDLYMPEPKEDDPTGNWTDPYQICKEDCSCTKRFIHDRYSMVKQRRRLTRKLQECAPLGDDPFKFGYDNERPCCAGLFPCSRDWFGQGKEFIRCSENQDICFELEDWKSSLNETPDPLPPNYTPYEEPTNGEGGPTDGPNPDHNNTGGEPTDGPNPGYNNTGGEPTDEEYSPMCDISTCNQSEGCMENVDLFMHFYSDSSRMGMVFDFLSMVNLSAMSPFYEFFKCHIDFANQIWIETLRSTNEPVSDDYCKMEIDDCFMESTGTCRKLFLVAASFSEVDRPMLMETVWSTLPPNTEKYVIEELFAGVDACFPLYMEDPHHNGDHDGHGGNHTEYPYNGNSTEYPKDGNSTEYPGYPGGPSGILVLPISSVPCACGDGFSSVYSKDSLNRDSIRNVKTTVDMCFASDQPVGNLQLQTWNSKSGFDGVKDWESPALDDNETFEKILHCLEAADTCNPEDVMLVAVFASLLEKRQIRPAANRCGYGALKGSGYSDIGEYETCGEFNVTLDLGEMYSAMLEEAQMPTLSILVAERDHDNEPDMMNELYRLHFESSSHRFQRSRIEMSSQFGIQSKTVVHERPEVDSTVTFDNCHELCVCDKLYLAEQWDMHHNMPGSLEVYDEDIPCACSHSNDQQRNKVTSRVVEVKDVYGNIMKEFKYEFDYCTTGERRLIADYEKNPYTLPLRWNWLCNCDLTYMSYESCLEDCQQVRGPWAWTCGGKEADGFAELDPFSPNTEELRSGMCQM